MPFFGISAQERFFWTIDRLDGELPARKTVLVGYAVRLPWIIKFHSTSLKGQFRLITGVGGRGGHMGNAKEREEAFPKSSTLFKLCKFEDVFTHAALMQATRHRHFNILLYPACKTLPAKSLPYRFSRPHIYFQ